MMDCWQCGQEDASIIIYLFIHIFYVFWVSLQPYIPVFSPNLFFNVNLVTKGDQKLFKTLAPQLTVLGIPHFPDAYSRALRPIDIQRKANTQRLAVFVSQWKPLPRLTTIPVPKRISQS
jgi:hypothetical protein